jgi:hypothetical protein
MPARRGGSTLRGFNKVFLDGDPEFADFTMSVAKMLGKPVTAVKMVSTEDDSDYYDMYIEQIQGETPISVPGFPGQASQGTLQGMPVVLTNDMGAGFIFM